MIEKILAEPQILTKLIEYQKGAIVSKALVQNDKGSITLFAFDAHEGLSQHSAPYDAFVMVLDGSLNVTVGDKTHSVSAGNCIIMPANIPHSVIAPLSAKMLLVMIKG